MPDLLDRLLAGRRMTGASPDRLATALLATAADAAHALPRGAARSSLADGCEVARRGFGLPAGDPLTPRALDVAGRIALARACLTRLGTLQRGEGARARATAAGLALAWEGLAAATLQPTPAQETRLVAWGWTSADALHWRDPQEGELLHWRHALRRIVRDEARGDRPDVSELAAGGVR